MSVTPIDALPTAPSRTSMTDAEFSAAADELVAALPAFVTQANALGAAVDSAASDASDSADDAAASATAAQTAATGTFNGTSATSITAGLGSKTFTTQAGKNWFVGSWLTVASAGTPSCSMYGYVDSYSGTTLTVIMNSKGIDGTHTDWVIALSGGPAS